MPVETPLTELRIAFNPGLDLATSLVPLGRWGDDGLDRWNGELLARTVRLGDAVVAYCARVTDSSSPELTVDIPARVESLSAAAAEEIARMFVDLPQSLSSLANSDIQVGRLLRLYPGIRPVLFRDPTAALIRSVSAQQVNLRWASTVRRRIAERYGIRHQVGDTYVYSFEAAPLAQATVDELRGLQLTTAKARSVIAVGEAAASGELDRGDLANLADDALIAHLTRIKGIGRWSAEWFLARTLGRPRVVAGDLGVRKAVARMYQTSTMPTEDDVRRLTAHWGESATVVQALALHHLIAEPTEPVPSSTPAPGA